MGRKVTYSDICNRLAAARCYLARISIKLIAESAGKTPATIRRWLKDAGVKSRVN